MTTASRVVSMKLTALDLAGLGWAVFPVTVRGKEPMKGTNGHLDATTDPKVIEKMWAPAALANIGIACDTSGLYVVDVDMTPWKGKQGEASWAELVAEHGHVDTYTVRTWSGGLHFYYRMPPGMSLANTTGKGSLTGRGLGRDIDTRGNGYVLGVGSVVNETYNSIPHTGEYVLEKDLPIADLPQWIIDAVKAPERRPALAGPLAADQAVMDRVMELAEEIRCAPVGQGNDTASRVAYRVGQYAGAGQLDEDVAISILMDAISGWSWQGENDFMAMSNTIIRGVEKGAQNPRAWERPIARQEAVGAPLGDQNATQDLPAVPDPVAAVEGHQPADEVARTLSMWSTDNGQGMWLRERVGDMLYAVGVGWMVWDDTRWLKVAPEVIENRVSRFYREEFLKALDRYSKEQDEKWLGLAKAYKSFMSTSRLGSILKHLKVTDGVLVDAGDLDRHPDLLNSPGGVIDLRTGKVSPHDRKMLFTKITNGRYVPDLKHPDWEIAITALDDEERDYMKLRFGQAITGHIPESDDAIFLIGNGSNGKSSFTSDGVLPAIGDYAALAQATLITKATEGGAATPERMALRGCRFVLIEELPEGRSLSMSEMKRVVGTRVVTARDLYEKQVTYTASHTLFITANFPPAIAEVDEGSWRRLCRVQFPYWYKMNPDGPQERRGDPGLKSRLSAGAQGQHDAIVTWLVEGAMAYYAEPSSIMENRRPQAIRDITMDWRKEADRILAYATERLHFPSATDTNERAVARDDLFDDFLWFLEQAGHAAWSRETFMSRFRTHSLVRAHAVNEGQTRDHGKIHRPAKKNEYAVRKDLPRVVRVFNGVRFRTEDDEDQ